MVKGEETMINMICVCDRRGGTSALTTSAPKYIYGCNILL